VSTSAPDTLVVLAKSPRTGRVKTRLTPTFTPEEAAALAAAAIRDTFDAVAEAAPRHTVVAWDGPFVPWLPPQATVLRQRGRGLDERLEAVFADLLRDGGDRPTLLVGMDTPQLRGADLDVDWRGADAVLGLCEDGGYWAIGMRRYRPGSILGVPMSTDHTGADQLDRLHGMGLTVTLLPTMRDVDDPADAAHVAALCPDSRFARLHRRLLTTPCCPTTLFDAAVAGREVTVHDEDPAGRAIAHALPGHALDMAAWSLMSTADELLVSRCEGPVLDIGCGPGRFVEALASRGVPALGVDVSRAAVARTSGRGGCALMRDVNERLPAEGRWATLLLADGNIGIGGDPLALLRRCRELLRAGGTTLVEVDPDDDADARSSLVLRGPSGRRSAPVPWAQVGLRALLRIAATADFVAVEDWRVDGRVFVGLRRAG